MAGGFFAITWTNKLYIFLPPCFFLYSYRRTRINLRGPRARQLVSHGHVMVNGKRVTIPSYNVKIGDIVSLSPKTVNLPFIKKLLEDKKEEQIPSWLNKKATVGKVDSLPKREDF